MAHTHSIMLFVFESAAAVFILLGVPLLRRRLRSSELYTRWSPSMLREATAWRAINQATGRDFIALGATLAPLAVWAWSMNMRPEVFALMCAGWVLLGATGVLIHSFVLVVVHRRR